MSLNFPSAALGKIAAKRFRTLANCWSVTEGHSELPTPIANESFPGHRGSVNASLIVAVRPQIDGEPHMVV